MTIVVGVKRLALHRQSVFKIVFDLRHRRLHVRCRDVEERAAEECRQIAVRREWRGWTVAHGRGIDGGGRAGQRQTERRVRWIAAIVGALIVIIFVGQFDLGGVVRRHRHGRVDAVTLELAVVAERVGAFVERVHANRKILTDRLTCIERDAAVAV